MLINCSSFMTIFLITLVVYVHGQIYGRTDEILFFYKMDGRSNHWSGSYVVHGPEENKCPDCTGWDMYEKFCSCWEVTGTTDAIWPALTLGTVGYRDVELRYCIKTVGVSSSKECMIEYSTDGGSIWSDVIRTSGSDLDPALDDQLFSGWGSAADNHNNLRLRLSGSGGGCHCYFSDLYLYGTPITSDPTTSVPTAPTSAPSLVPISDPTIPTFAPSYDPSNPTSAPSNDPISTQSSNPSSVPSNDPISTLSSAPTQAPLTNPSVAPSASPSYPPTIRDRNGQVVEAYSSISPMSTLDMNTAYKTTTDDILVIVLGVIAAVAIILCLYLLRRYSISKRNTRMTEQAVGAAEQATKTDNIDQEQAVEAVKQNNVGNIDPEDMNNVDEDTMQKKEESTDSLYESYDDQTTAGNDNNHKKEVHVEGQRGEGERGEKSQNDQTMIKNELEQGTCDVVKRQESKTDIKKNDLVTATKGENVVYNVDAVMKGSVMKTTGDDALQTSKGGMDVHKPAAS
eukprot:740660_1